MFFKKKLNAKEILFPLQKDLISSFYELKKTTLDDSRKPRGLDSKLQVGNVYRECPAFVFFLIFSPIKLSNLPSSVEILLAGYLKAWAMALTTGFEKKDEKQKFIESRFNEYYRTLSGGYDAAEICSKYLDFYGLVDHENDIVQNLSFTSFVDGLFLSSMQIIGAAKKDFKLIYTPINQGDLDKLSAQFREIHEANKPSSRDKIETKQKPKPLTDENEDELENFKDGEYIEYYDNGEIESKSNYKDGHLHGQHTEWGEEGELSAEENYKDGEKHGRQISYLGGEIFDEENYKDGDKHGRQVSYLDGKIFSEENYIDGDKHGRQISYLDGEVLEEENYKDGEKHGRQISYFDGEITEEENYKDGEYIEDEYEEEDEYEDEYEDEENKPKSLMDEIGSSLGLEGFIKMQQELWGDNSSGCAEDEMPNGIGEFGIEPTNPIPVNTVELGSKKYLAGLRAEDGSKVNSERIGSQTVDNIEKPIDSYIITHKDGSEIATIYISPYQAKNSKKAPRGLKQVSK
ncbi:toxin-antitoxin system YwqK family antitoxin [Candidatus Pseudothioglobus singularis]|nr:toxin-antitoxin system YwqK family antitoxin [Candidatus Pseudothioglobus singularis]